MNRTLCLIREYLREYREYSPFEILFIFFFLRLRLKLETQTFYFGSLFKETKEMDFLVRYPRARARIFPHVKTTNGGHA